MNRHSLTSEYDIVLELKDIHHGFAVGGVLHDINLQVARGQFVGLVGASGVGKSTLLRAILGTHLPHRGAVLMNGIPVTGPGRDRGIVYQRYSLFPYMTAVQNTAFGLMLAEAPLLRRVFQFWKCRTIRQRHLKEAERLLQKFGLGSKQFHSYPHQLSGGESQRVAVAQALIVKPQILLLDEPFGALDEGIREQQQHFLLELYEENLEAIRAGRKPPYTVILVTHELNEALKVADRVIALSKNWQSPATNGAHQGATIVYDAVAPEYHPGDDFGMVAAVLKQRAEIRKAAFAEYDSSDAGGNYVRFWNECSAGSGGGVMRPAFNCGRSAGQPMGDGHPDVSKSTT